MAELLGTSDLVISAGGEGFLTAADFADFYRGVHGFDPFPWQEELVAEVLQSGTWPNLVDVPTGLGKTSLLDVAVFVAAATSHLTGADRVGRRRCLFVVDRRVVVDEAYEHAKAIAQAIQEISADDRSREAEARRAVAQGIRRFRAYAPASPSTRLLPVTRMRGGTTWASSWSSRPDDPAVVIGTVDQVGSRLLFRGYGVSDRRKPLDAALVGTDSLLLVDEAHLARALLTTATSAGQRDRSPLPLPGLDIVRLTATASPAPTADAKDSSGPADKAFHFDVPAHQENEEAQRRLTAAKHLVVRSVDKKALPKELAEAAEHFTAPVTSNDAEPGSPIVLVVCNTIDTARSVHTILRERVARVRAGLQADVSLLIGRSRPVDRVGLDQKVRERFGVGAPRTSKPAILVATQTVEVGINLDVDVLITESASWDALVQRLGRLNRMGKLPDRLPGVKAALALIVHDEQVDGPVYGSARDNAWQYLQTLTAVSDGPLPSLRDGLNVTEPVDMSPLHCRELAADVPPNAFMTPPDVPVLTAPILDRWARTGPIPLDDPPIHPYLHGLSAGSPAVSLLWRDGLGAESDTTDLEDEWIEDHERSNLLLGALAPLAGEQVEVPLVAVQRWMQGMRPVPVSDLDAAPDAPGQARQDREPFEVLAKRSIEGNQDAWQWKSHWELRPGDQLVAPTVRGGLDAYGWNPSSQAPVTDALELAALDTGQLRLIIDERLPQRLDVAMPQARRIEVVIAALAHALRRDESNSTDSLADEEPHAVNESESIADLEALLSDQSPAKLTKRLLIEIADALDFQSPTEEEVSAPQGTSPDSVANGWRIGDRRKKLRDLVHLAVSCSHRRPLARLLTPRRSPGTAGLHAKDALPVILTWRAPRDPNPAASSISDVERNDDDSVSSSIGSIGQVSLDQHHMNVKARALDIARNLRLDEDLVTLIGDASGWHDLGKNDPRFQAMLHGGDLILAAINSSPLAKSGMDPNDRSAWLLANRKSGLPYGARHEAWSAALVAEHLEQNPYLGDQQLLIHLIAAHHGHARPLLPFILDERPNPITAPVNGDTVTVPSDRTVDPDHPGHFAALNQRYGRWGLALLESIVRCADMTVSAEGS